MASIALYDGQAPIPGVPLPRLVDPIYQLAVSHISALFFELPKNGAVVANYLHVLEEYWQNLDWQEKAITPQPTVDDVKSFFASRLAVVVVPPQKDTIWDYVLKDTPDNKIYMAAYTLEDFGKATTDRGSLPPSGIMQLLITLIFMHELTHALTKKVFGLRHTPKGCGPTDPDGHGEAGWLLEELMFGGSIFVDCEEGRQDTLENAVFVVGKYGGMAYSVPERDLRRWAYSVNQDLLYRHAPVQPLGTNNARESPYPAPGYARDRLSTILSPSSPASSPTRGRPVVGLGLPGSTLMGLTGTQRSGAQTAGEEDDTPMKRR